MTSSTPDRQTSGATRHDQYTQDAQHTQDSQDSQRDPGKRGNVRQGRSPISERGLGFVMILASVVLLLVGVIDPLLGNGFETVTVAFGLLVLPQGIQRVTADRSSVRLRARLRLFSRLGMAAAVLLVWGGLIADWNAGRGVSWLVLLGGVCLLVATLLTGAGVIAERRSAKAGTSARMNA